MDELTKKREERQAEIEGMRDSLIVLGTHSENYYKVLSNAQVIEAYNMMMGIETGGRS